MQLFLGGFKSWVKESLIVEWQADCSLLSSFLGDWRLQTPCLSMIEKL